MVAITGANGYVGGQLCAALERCGRAARRLVRHPEASRGDVFFDLSAPITEGTLSGVETLVHAAHDFSPRSEAELRRVNLEGTRRLFEAARRAGVSRIVFVSSLASFEASHSAYGRVKWAIEAETTATGGISLRPGTIFGSQSGGLFGSLERAVRALPLLPDFGARARLHVVHAADLTRVIEALIARETPTPPAALAVAHPDDVSLREMLEAVGRASGGGPRFVRVPPGLALAGLRLLESLGLNPPFRGDSLIGMLHRNPDPGLAPEVLGVPLRRFSAEALAG